MTCHEYDRKTIGPSLQQLQHDIKEKTQGQPGPEKLKQVDQESGGVQ